MKNPIPFLVLAALCLTLPVRAADKVNQQVIGMWNTDSNRAKVEIYERDGKINAKLVTLKEPNFPANDKRGMGGKPKVDRDNPDPKLRSRPLAGMEFMSGLKPAGPGKWEGGLVYDPETGSTYKCKFTLVGTNKIEMRGFLGISLIGRTTTWTR